MVALLALALAVAGCSTPAGAQGDVLEVHAASSLAAVTELLFAGRARPEPVTSLVLTTDSSAALATRILEGAPADLFLAADLANPGRVAGAGLAAGPVVAFAANRIVLAVPAANPAGIRTPADLARPGLRLIGAGAKVPLQRYADEAVARLAGLPGAPAGFAAAVAANLVSREDNAGAVVARLALGEGDAAFVYATDVAAADGALAEVPLPADAVVRATYGAVVLAASPRRAAAQAFLAWIRGPEGQAILARAGFAAP